jgi:hypothetical protein
MVRQRNIKLREVGGEKVHLFLQGSQALRPEPSDKRSVKMKTLEWIEMVASDRGSGILIL